MRPIVFCIGFFAMWSGIASPQDVIAIRSATLVDASAGQAHERTTIVIREGVIAAVGPDDRITVPPGARVLDGSKRWVMPGLIEVHTHSIKRSEWAQALTLGVTTALVIAPAESLVALARWSAQPSSPSPRLFITPGGLTGSFPEPFVHGITLYRPSSPVQARRDVEQLTRHGAASLKIWQDDGSLWVGPTMRLPTLPPQVLRMIVRTAHQHGARVYGHAWRARDARALLDAGIDGIIHMVADSVLDFPFVQRFAGRHVPTATTIAGGLLWFFDRPTYARLVLADPRLLASLPDSARIAERATLARDTSLGPSHDTTFAYIRSHLASYRATVGRNARALLDAGAPLAVGSDGPVGVATHLEMELMVEGGLTTAEVLTAATIGGARLLGLEDELGTIAPGKRADIVGLRADPLKNVRNARDVGWVIKAGHLVDRASIAR